MADAGPGDREQGRLAGGILADPPDELDRATGRGSHRRNARGETAGLRGSAIRAGHEQRRADDDDHPRSVSPPVRCWSPGLVTDAASSSPPRRRSRHLRDRCRRSDPRSRSVGRSREACSSAAASSWPRGPCRSRPFRMAPASRSAGRRRSGRLTASGASRSASAGPSVRSIPSGGWSAGAEPGSEPERGAGWRRPPPGPPSDPRARIGDEDERGGLHPDGQWAAAAERDAPAVGQGRAHRPESACGAWPARRRRPAGRRGSAATAAMTRSANSADGWTSRAASWDSSVRAARSTSPSSADVGSPPSAPLSSLGWNGRLNGSPRPSRARRAAGRAREQVGLHGPDRPAGLGCDLGQGQLRVEPEHDRLAIRVIECGHGLPDGLRALGAERDRGRVRCAAETERDRRQAGPIVGRTRAIRTRSDEAVRIGRVDPGHGSSSLGPPDSGPERDPTSHAPNGPSPRQPAVTEYAITNDSWAASSASWRSPRTRWQARTTDVGFLLHEVAEVPRGHPRGRHRPPGGRRDPRAIGRLGARDQSAIQFDSR